jgi:TatD DNase family protein
VSTPYIDIHTHHFSNREEVISFRSIDVNEYLKAPELINQLFSIGLHPWFLTKENSSTNLLVVEELINHDNLIAIGECGLDKIIDVDYAYQQQVFKSQIQLSEKYLKPLIIHQVKSHEELLKIKRDLSPIQPWIIHGTRLKWTIAKDLLNVGMYLSFGHHLLKSEPQLIETFLQTPNDKIFLETDNSAIAIDDIFVKAAEIKSMEVQTLKEIVYQNFKTVFKK